VHDVKWLFCVGFHGSFGFRAMCIRTIDHQTSSSKLDICLIFVSGLV
jgi:hypothetical protein